MGVRRAKWEMTKAQGDKFKRDVLQVLKAHHATRNTGYMARMYNLRVPTPAGTLLIDTTHVDEGSIFGRFVRPELGRKCVRSSNPYSGKWNFHFGRSEARGAASYFRGAMDRLMVCRVGKR